MCGDVHRKADFYGILTEPENSLIRQQQQLLSTEGVELHFTNELGVLTCVLTCTGRRTSTAY